MQEDEVKLRLSRNELFRQGKIVLRRKVPLAVDLAIGGRYYFHPESGLKHLEGLQANSGVSVASEALDRSILTDIEVPGIEFVIVPVCQPKRKFEDLAPGWWVCEHSGKLWRARIFGRGGSKCDLASIDVWVPAHNQWRRPPHPAWIPMAVFREQCWTLDDWAIIDAGSECLKPAENK